MQDATWHDQVNLGNEEVNAKRIESLTATICPCRFLQKIDFMGPFSNPRTAAMQFTWRHVDLWRHAIRQHMQFLGYLCNR